MSLGNNNGEKLHKKKPDLLNASKDKFKLIVVLCIFVFKLCLSRIYTRYASKFLQPDRINCFDRINF